MVKVGFICEGETEKIIVESENFKQLLIQNNCVFLKAIDATGNGNLLPKNISPFINVLIDEGADKIFILSDLDLDECITKTKLRIDAPESIIVIIAVKQIESWILADAILLSNIFNEPYLFAYPERENIPRETLRKLFIEKIQRGIGNSKPKFAYSMVSQGFSILNAANNPQCYSAKYFIKKLESLSEDI